MYSKILVLRFSKDVAQKPVVYHLTKDFDLVFNILNATILPGKEGVMVMELAGSNKDVNVVAELGRRITAEVVVLTTGTFLRGRIPRASRARRGRR